MVLELSLHYLTQEQCIYSPCPAAIESETSLMVCYRMCRRLDCVVHMNFEEL